MTVGLRCPGCDIPGDLGARHSLFGDRGIAEDGLSIVRCGNCGCGFHVMPRRLLRRVRARLIAPDEWARMEHAWERDNPLPATAAPPLPDPRALAEELAGSGVIGAHTVHQLAEATELSEDEARALLSEFQAP